MGASRVVLGWPVLENLNYASTCDGRRGFGCQFEFESVAASGNERQVQHNRPSCNSAKCRRLTPGNAHRRARFPKSDRLGQLPQSRADARQGETHRKSAIRPRETVCLPVKTELPGTRDGQAPEGERK